MLSAQLSRDEIARGQRIHRLQHHVNFDKVVAQYGLEEDVIEFFSRRAEAFALDENDLGDRGLVEHRIETGNRFPFNEKGRLIGDS